MNRLSMMQEMLDLQDSMNSKVNPEWKNAGYNWKRAAWVECAELMEHISYKWWKKQELNSSQAKLELVDIWHFMLSEAILNDLDSEKLLFSLEEVPLDYYEGIDTRELIEDLVFYLLDEIGGEDYFALFFLICERLELSFEDMYKLYIGKNVLNKFRQDNGYKEGTYRKHWAPKDVDGDGHPVEDNDFLTMILDTAPEEVSLQEYVYKQLEKYYNREITPPLDYQI